MLKFIKYLIENIKEKRKRNREIREKIRKDKQRKDNVVKYKKQFEEGVMRFASK